jgi:Chaperone of endosialidase/Head domain of trimeric autotransporter adhesin
MEFKKKLILTVAVMGLGIAASHAQTGIGTNNADNSAQLDVASDKRGFLMPRLALVKTTEKTPIVGTVAKSLMVYNTATANDVTPGYYFWDGAKWIRITDETTIPKEPWFDVATNTGATANTQNIYQTGNVAIGKSTVQKGVALDVKGAIRVGETSGEPAIGVNSIAIGTENIVSGTGSIAVGNKNNVAGIQSLAVGSENVISKANSVIFGSYNSTESNMVLLSGYMNNVLGKTAEGSVLMGTSNVIGAGVNVKDNMLFGRGNTVNGDEDSNVSMSANVAFGMMNRIEAPNNTNMIQGVSVFGFGNSANFDSKGAITNATVFGNQNLVSSDNQFVIGIANVDVPNALFEIGNGTPQSGIGPSVPRSTFSSNALTVLKNGNVGIGTTAPDAKLVVVGDLKVTGAITGTSFNGQYFSDRRFKKDIVPIGNALTKIKNIEGVEYNWRVDEFKDKNFDNKHQYGVIAQDIEKILPELVKQDDKGYYSVNYIELVPILIEAVKEQEAIMEKQDKKIADLESRLLKLEKLMDK